MRKNVSFRFQELEHRCLYHKQKILKQRDEEPAWETSLSPSPPKKAKSLVGYIVIKDPPDTLELTKCIWQTVFKGK